MYLFSDLQDDIMSFWDENILASAIEPYIVANNITTVCYYIIYQDISLNLPPLQILTFDLEGISSHLNHKSLPRGVQRLLSSWTAKYRRPAPRIFVLITVPLVQKYLGPLAALLAKFDFATITLLQYFGSPPDAFHGGKPLSVFVSGAQDYLIALKAMMQHRSQLVWFRWLYIAFSRYMWVNEWMEILPA